MKEAYPRAESTEREQSPAGTTDWNEVLHAAGERRERAERHGQGQEDDWAPGRNWCHSGCDEHGRR